MRLHVELEDGKEETVFVPAAAFREKPDDVDDDNGFDMTCYLAWWAMHRRGLTDADNWQEFSYVAMVTAAEDDDPK